MAAHASLTLKELSIMIGRTKSLVALTGAGISTSAGIPDFRGPKGLYTTHSCNMRKTFAIGDFRRKPKKFYDFAKDFVTMAETVQPTSSHFFLSRLAAKGALAGIVTQNIDGLHDKAGNEKVIELHGSYRSAVCLGCGETFHNRTHAWWLETMEKSPQKPIAICVCGGLLKPDIVFFGERVHQYADAKALVSSCDLLLVLGSSLAVSPASQLPHATKAPTVIINQGRIDLDPAPNRFHIVADLDEYLEQVSGHLWPDGC